MLPSALYPNLLQVGATVAMDDQKPENLTQVFLKGIVLPICWDLEVRYTVFPLSVRLEDKINVVGKLLSRLIYAKCPFLVFVMIYYNRNIE